MPVAEPGDWPMPMTLTSHDDSFSISKMLVRQSSVDAAYPWVGAVVGRCSATPLRRPALPQQDSPRSGPGHDGPKTPALGFVSLLSQRTEQDRLRSKLDQFLELLYVHIGKEFPIGIVVHWNYCI